MNPIEKWECAECSSQYSEKFAADTCCPTVKSMRLIPRYSRNVLICQHCDSTYPFDDTEDAKSCCTAITHHCPNCEAAQRELADIAAVLRTGSSGDTLLGKEVSQWIDTAHAVEAERDDLRARLEALCVEMETDDRAGKLAHWIGAIRALLAETEGK